MAETKGNCQELQLKGAENLKIQYAKRYFEHTFSDVLSQVTLGFCLLVFIHSQQIFHEFLDGQYDAFINVIDYLQDLNHFVILLASYFFIL